MDDSYITELEYKAAIYDALTGVPGYEDLNTLRDWFRLVKGIEYVVGPLTERLNRIAAHIANQEATAFIASQERRMSES